MKREESQPDLCTVFGHEERLNTAETLRIVALRWRDKEPFVSIYSKKRRWRPNRSKHCRGKGVTGCAVARHPCSKAL